MSRTTHTTAAAVILIAAGLLLTGCGDNASTSSASSTSSTAATPSASSSAADSTPTASSSANTAPASSPAPEPVTALAVTIKGDTVTPNGRRLKATVGEPVVITVNSDRAGELHVHSTPEEELAYGKGTTTLKVKVDKPGIVDIEDHIADVVIVQLEVS